MAEFQEKLILPSFGVLEGIPKEVTLRAMNTGDEKLLVGSQGENGIDSVIRNCIVAPANIDMDALLSSDKLAILLKLRAVSYGNIYQITYKCPYCGKKNTYDIDLDKLETNYLEEGFQEPYDTFNLPTTGDEIALRLPRSGDLKDLELRVKRYYKRFPEAKGDISVIFNLAVNIATVNGKDLNSNELNQYLEKLPVKDSEYIKHRINKLKVGPDARVFEECAGCGEDLDFSLPIGADFFRTKYND